jgi:hypothetical protein
MPVFPGCQACNEGEGIPVQESLNEIQSADFHIIK